MSSLVLQHSPLIAGFIATKELHTIPLPAAGSVWVMPRRCRCGTISWALTSRLFLRASSCDSDTGNWKVTEDTASFADSTLSVKTLSKHCGGQDSSGSSGRGSRGNGGRHCHWRAQEGWSKYWCNSACYWWMRRQAAAVRLPGLPVCGLAHWCAGDCASFRETRSGKFIV